MNRDAAIEAALQALAEDGVLIEADEIRTLVAAVIDAAAPHLVGEPVGWAVVFDEPTRQVAVESTIYLNRDEFDRDYPSGTPGVRRCALVPVEDQP